jgi:multiple sugar transport system substrate-binding protein
MKTRSQKKLAVAACIAAGALAFTACGSSSNSKSSSGGGHVTLTELDDYGPGLPQYAAFKWLLADYEKTHPNIKIARESVAGAEILPKLLAESQTNTLPDLAVPDNPDMPNIEATNKFLNLNADLAKWGQWQDYLAGSKAVTSDKSGTFGIEIGTNDLGMIYNKKVFAQAGITTLPKTWAQLLTVSKQLVAKDKNLTYGAIGFGGGCTDWQLDPWFYSEGININQLTSPKMVAAVDFWAKLLKSGLASKEVITQCQSTNIPQMIQGKVAMVEDGPWDFPTLDAAHADWGDFAIPLASAGDKESVPLGGEVWTIPKSSAATETAAWNFIKWSQTPKILLQFDAKLGYIAVRPALWPTEEKADPRLTAFIQELKYAQGRTTVLGANFNTYGTDLNTATVQVLLGQKTAPVALAAAQKAAQATISSSS